MLGTDFEIEDLEMGLSREHSKDSMHVIKSSKPTCLPKELSSEN